MNIIIYLPLRGHTHIVRQLYHGTRLLHCIMSFAALTRTNICTNCDCVGWNQPEGHAKINPYNAYLFSDVNIDINVLEY